MERRLERALVTSSMKLGAELPAVVLAHFGRAGHYKQVISMISIPSSHTTLY